MDDRSPIRRREGFGREDVLSLLRATCNLDPGAPIPLHGHGRRPCTIIAERGLFNTPVEDAGRFDLYLLGQDDVRLQELWLLREESVSSPPDAFVSYRCARDDRDWAIRHPDADKLAAMLKVRFNLRPVWKARIAGNCDYVWLTPGGQLRDASRLPEPRQEGRSTP
jgi:hypothetical protein